MHLYYDMHDGTGPYVLMVHGFLSSRAHPGLRVVGANAGHAVNIEAAETFNTAVVDFLRRHPLRYTLGCRADGKAWSANTNEEGNR
jgi:hypothetical protein